MSAQARGADPRRRPPLRRAGLPRHVARRPRRGARRAEGRRSTPTSTRRRTCSGRSRCEGAEAFHAGARRGARGRGRASSGSGSRCARTCASSPSSSTSPRSSSGSGATSRASGASEFVAERRRYEERVPRRSSARGASTASSAPTSTTRTAALLVALGRELGLHLAAARREHRRARRPLLRGAARRHARLRDALSAKRRRTDQHPSGPSSSWQSNAGNDAMTSEIGLGHRDDQGRAWHARPRKGEAGAPHRQSVLDTGDRAGDRRGRACRCGEGRARDGFTEHPGTRPSSRPPRRRRVDAIVVFSGDGDVNEALNGRDGATAARVPARRRHERPAACARPAARPGRGRARRRRGARARAGTRRITLGRVNGRRFASRRGHRLRRGGGAPARRARRATRRQAPGRPRLRGRDRGADARRAARPLRAGARDRGLRPRGVRVRRATASPYSYAASVPLRDRAGRALRARARRSRRPCACAAATCRARDGASPSRRGAIGRTDVLYGPRPRPDRGSLRPAAAAAGRRRGPRRRRPRRCSRPSATRSRSSCSRRCDADPLVTPPDDGPGRDTVAGVAPSSDEDRELDGLDASDLLELYRRMVLLRTYDERSVVYHRQGRIGTYAIFWNHEAMQAGSRYALARRRLDLPELPRVGDRARCAGCPPRRCCTGGAATRPAGGTRPTTTSPRSASRSRPTCRTRPVSRGARS